MKRTHTAMAAALLTLAALGAQAQDFHAGASIGASRWNNDSPDLDVELLSVGISVRF